MGTKGVNLVEAGVEELQKIKHIGPVRAECIISYRQALEGRKMAFYYSDMRRLMEGWRLPKGRLDDMILNGEVHFGNYPPQTSNDEELAREQERQKTEANRNNYTTEDSRADTESGNDSTDLHDAFEARYLVEHKGRTNNERGVGEEELAEKHGESRKTLVWSDPGRDSGSLIEEGLASVGPIHPPNTVGELTRGRPTAGQGDSNRAQDDLIHLSPSVKRLFHSAANQIEETGDYGIGTRMSDPTQRIKEAGYRREEESWRHGAVYLSRGDYTDKSQTEFKRSIDNEELRAPPAFEDWDSYGGGHTTNRSSDNGGLREPPAVQREDLPRGDEIGRLEELFLGILTSQLKQYTQSSAEETGKLASKMDRYNQVAVEVSNRLEGNMSQLAQASAARADELESRVGQFAQASAEMKGQFAQVTVEIKGHLAQASVETKDQINRITRASAAKTNQLEEKLNSLARTVEYIMQTGRTGELGKAYKSSETNSRGLAKPVEKLVTFVETGGEATLRGESNYYSSSDGAPKSTTEKQPEKETHGGGGLLGGAPRPTLTRQRTPTRNDGGSAKANTTEGKRPMWADPASTSDPVDRGDRPGSKLLTPSWSANKKLPASPFQSTWNTGNHTMGTSYGLAGVQPAPVLDQYQGASPYIRENPLLPQQTGGQGAALPGLYSGPCPGVVAASTPPQLIEQWKQEGYSQGLMEGISMMRKEMAQMNPQASRDGDDGTYARTTGAGIPLTPAAGSTTGGSQDSPGRRGRKRNGRRRRREQDTHSFLSMGGQRDSDRSDTAGSLQSPGPYSMRTGPLRTNIDPPDNKATFNGTHWKGFICLLEEQAAEYRWDKDVKLSHFRKALKGPAADFFSTLPQSTRRDYHLLKTRFQQHYEPKELPLVAR